MNNQMKYKVALAMLAGTEIYNTKGNDDCEAVKIIFEDSVNVRVETVHNKDYVKFRFTKGYLDVLVHDTNNGYFALNVLSAFIEELSKIDFNA